MIRVVGPAAGGRVEFSGDELRQVTIGGKAELLPSDPIQIAKIIRERRNKRTPAQALRAKIDASLKRRVGH